ncbi:MAG: selenocysteine-specific translation elongation factor [Thermoanaerobaculia bacterium]
MKRVIVGTAGHIDHGKSALVKTLTGTDPDRLPEEKARGITIDLGFAHAEWGGVSFSFIDVPGHERFVRTMVAGAQGIDIALLVVASDDAVMPQTREHLAILKLLDVRHAVLVRTKSDLVDEESGGLVEDELRQLVKGSAFENALFVAFSSVSGEGLEAVRAALLETAVKLQRPGRTERIPRLALDRAFAIKGFGPVVTGTLDGGKLALEDRLVVVPEGHEVRVRRIEVHGEERPEAWAGERTSLNLAGVEISDLRRGQTLVSPGALVPSRLLTVELQLLPSMHGPLADGARVRLHHGTAEVGARLALVFQKGEASPGEVKPGEAVVAQLLLESPLAALRHDRFVLRRPSPMETIGGGTILDPGRERIRARTGLSAESQRILAKGDDEAVTALLIRDAGPAATDAAALALRLGVSVSQVARHLEALLQKGEALRIGAGLVAAARGAEEMARRVDSIFAERKRAGAPSLALPRGEFLSRLGAGLSPASAEGWLALLAASKKISVDGDRVGPPGGTSGLSEDATGFAAHVAEGYRTGGFEAPKSFDLARALHTKPAVVDGLVTHLLKSGVLVRLSPDLVVHRETLASIDKKLETVAGQTLGVGGFRDLFGLTRKNLIPLLEFLDQRKKTRRNGDVRVVV